MNVVGQQVRPAVVAGTVLAVGLVAAGIGYWLSRRPKVTIIDKNPAFEARTPRKLPIRGIVIHQTITGSAAATERVLRQRGFSTHFEVDRQGRVYRYLDPKLWVAIASNWANQQFIGIDVTHLSSQNWPEVQLVATAALVSQLQREFELATGVASDGIRWTKAAEVPADIGILRHRNITATCCPGSFPMERLGPVIPPAPADLVRRFDVSEKCLVHT